MDQVAATVPAHAAPVVRRRVVTLPILLGAVLLAAVAVETPRHVSWYLAVDQFGYLTLAGDLASGRFFHDWAPLDGLGPRLATPIDVLVQTWVFDGARLYSRYAPGYPLLLAGAMRLFGIRGALYLNVAILMALLGVLIWLGRRLLGDTMLAVVGAGLVLACPTWVAMWARSPLRDLPAQLAGLAGVGLAIAAADHDREPRGVWRWLAAGIAMGYAVAIRPDAVLWAPSAVLAIAVCWRRAQRPMRALLRPAAAAALGGTLGLMPLFAYNVAVGGNPFGTVQGVEARDFFAADATPGRREGTYRGTTGEAVSGGGLRLGNLPRTLPVNLDGLRRAWGDVLLAIALAGAVFALRRRPLLAAVTLPHAILGVLFYSCWVHADVRYLAGVMLVLSLLVAAGLGAAFAGLASVADRLGRFAVAPLLLAIAAVALLPPATAPRLWGDPPGVPRLSTLVVLVVATLWCLRPPWRPPSLPRALRATLAGVLAALLLGRALIWTSEPALFREETMRQARRTLASAIEPGAVVVSSEDIGRPVENIEYWSGGVHAVYLTDLTRWRLAMGDLVRALAGVGRSTYLLLPPLTGDDALERALAGEGLTVELVRAIPPSDALTWFVGSRAHRGVPLNLHRVRPAP